MIICVQRGLSDDNAPLYWLDHVPNEINSHLKNTRKYRKVMYAYTKAMHECSGKSANELSMQ